MTDLQTQLDWESEMIHRGVQRYRAQQQLAIEGGREHETSAGSRLLQSYVLQIADHMRAYLDGIKGRRRSSCAPLLKAINTDALAMFTLRSVIGLLFAGRKDGTREPLQTLCATIGTMAEDELRFSAFQTEHKTYYDAILRRLEEGRTKSYRHIHRNLVHSANALGVDWSPWSHETKISVGALAVQLSLEVSDLIEIERVPRTGPRMKKYVVPSAQCLEWIDKHDVFAELIAPDRMPCLIPPGDWTSAFDGGYWSPHLRNITPLIKRSVAGSSKRTARIEAAVMPRVLSAVNGLQATPWRLNQPVLEVMKAVWTANLPIGMPRSQPYEIPPAPVEPDDKPGTWADDDPRKEAFLNWKAEAREIHTMETERVAKTRALVRTLRLADELKDRERFYYVYTCDFRGRIYCATTGLSPQGTDHSKALLLFGRTEPLGERGMYWLKVHGANKFGYDKVSYDDRTLWVDKHHALWLAIAADPVGQRSHWAGCDKPWQFLAWVFEYTAASNAGPDYRSSLPVALDGSCNGLQHFSAMLRDPVGGQAVNLLAAPVPADIYQRVADVATRKLRGLRALNTPAHAGAINWLNLFEQVGGHNADGMPRELSKKPVMTLPYGSTRTACSESIFRWIMDEAPTYFDKNTNFKHALYLTPILWSSISEVVVAARDAMKWVQDCSSILTKKQHPLAYTSPLGFPVYQSAFKFRTKQIETQIGGRIELRIAIPGNKLDGRKQRQGSSPNLVHHADATHLMMVVNAGLAEDIDCFSMIHDDFGCHAGRIDTLQRIIRETFVDLHENHDILADFKAEHEARHDLILPDLPPRGDLDLSAVKHSAYFFG